MSFKPKSMLVEWSGSKEKTVSFPTMWLLNMNYLLNLVLECQREKWFICIYSDDILIVNVACWCGDMYLTNLRGISRVIEQRWFSPLYSNLVVETLEMDGFAQGECRERRRLSVESLEPLLFSGEVRGGGAGKVVQNWGKTRTEHLSGPTKQVLKALLGFTCLVIDFS